MLASRNLVRATPKIQPTPLVDATARPKTVYKNRHLNRASDARSVVFAVFPAAPACARITWEAARRRRGNSQSNKPFRGGEPDHRLRRETARPSDARKPFLVIRPRRASRARITCEAARRVSRNPGEVKPSAEAHQSSPPCPQQRAGEAKFPVSPRRTQTTPPAKSNNRRAVPAFGVEGRRVAWGVARTSRKRRTLCVDEFALNRY